MLGRRVAGTENMQAVALLYKKIIPPLSNFQLSASQTWFWCEEFQLHFERWQDFSEEKSQDSHGRLARNENLCLPSGVPCHLLALLPGERPELSIAWGKPAEKAPVVSFEGRKILVQSDASIKCSVFPWSIRACIPTARCLQGQSQYSQGWRCQWGRENAKERGWDSGEKWKLSNWWHNLKVKKRIPWSNQLMAGADWEQGPTSRYCNSNLKSNNYFRQNLKEVLF